MERYGRSYISNQENVNQSNISDESIKSILHSRIEMERKQVSLMETLKISTIVVVIFIAIFTAKFLLNSGKSSDSNCANNDSAISYFKRLKYQTFGGRNPDSCQNEGKEQMTTLRDNSGCSSKEDKLKEQEQGFWSMLSSLPGFANADYKKQDHALRNQSFTVKNKTTDFPKPTKNDPKTLNFDFEPSDYDLNKSNSSINSYLNNLQTNLSSTEPSKTQLDTLETLLDQKNIFNLQSKINDFVNSQKNLNIKRKDLAEFNAEYTKSVAALSECPQLLAQHKEALSLLKNKEKEEEKNALTLSQEVKEIELEIKKISEKSSQSEALLKIKELESDSLTLKNKIANISGIKSKLTLKERELEEHKKSLSAISLRDSQLQQENQSIADSEINYQAQIEELYRQIKAKEKSKTLTQMKLEFASRNKYIKDFLSGLVNETGSWSNSLESTLNEQISAEQELKKKIRTILEDQESNEFKITDRQIQDLIDHEKEDISKINSLYRQLIETIKLYKEINIDIKETKLELSQLDQDIKDLKAKIYTLENNIKSLNKQKTDKNKERESLGLKREVLDDKIDQIVKFLEDNRFDEDGLRRALSGKEKEIKELKEIHNVM